jgi:AcrR family transcriptional regulator
MVTGTPPGSAVIGPDDIPDPAASLFRTVRSGQVQLSNRGWLGQRGRRSDIYAAARILMTDAGYDGVQMQQIAARCNISPQTIYNLVGAKTQVMEQAAADWVDGIRAAAVRRAPLADVNSAFLMVEMFWDSALTYRDWVRIASLSSASPNDPLNRAFYRAALVALTAEIRGLKNRGALRQDADVDSLARQLTATAQITIGNWSVHPSDVSSFRRDLISGPAAMLRAWLQGCEAAKLEHYLQARYPVRLSPSQTPPAGS